jgi:hypothetical protein
MEVSETIAVSKITRMECLDWQGGHYANDDASEKGGTTNKESSS